MGHAVSFGKASGLKLPDNVQASGNLNLATRLTLETMLTKEICD